MKRERLKKKMLINMKRKGGKKLENWKIPWM